MSQQSSAGSCGSWASWGSSPFDESEAADMLTSMVAGGPILDGAYFSGVRPNAGPDAEEATPTDSTKPVSPRTPSPRVRTACSAPTPATSPAHQPPSRSQSAGCLHTENELARYQSASLGVWFPENRVAWLDT